jgi:hypothetical protein
MSFLNRLFGRGKKAAESEEEPITTKADSSSPPGKPVVTHQASIGGGQPPTIHRHVPGTANHGGQQARLAIIMLESSSQDRQDVIAEIVQDHVDFGTGTRGRTYIGQNPEKLDPETLLFIIARAERELKDESLLMSPIYMCHGSTSGRNISYAMVKMY